MASQANVGRATWLVNRLRCMSIAEVVYRVEQTVVTQLTKRRFVPTTPPAATRLIEKEPVAAPCPAGINAASYIQETDDILNGQVILFASRRFTVGSPPQWNRDPLTGVLGPTVFGGTLSITNRERVGDIKHVWEFNRHLHLVRLAQAFALTSDERYANGLAAQINSWLEQCPALMGPNWTSSLEAGIRLINWSLIWRILGGWDAPFFNRAGGNSLRERWLMSVFAHCQFISRHFSRHSSANNHLIGELSGLFVASCTWPYWPQCDSWANAAKRGLEREAVLQHSSDGVNREQAFAYQIFAAEFLLVAGVAGQRSGDAFSQAYWQAIEGALFFLKSVRDVGGHVPMVGDADDGIVWRLEPGDTGDRAEMILAIGDAVFGDSRGSETPDTVKWLLDPSARVDLAKRNGNRSNWQFPDGGYFMFGSHFGEPDEIKGMVDCGPLGYLGIAAHGHADALSVTLSVAGEECLVDPGTFSYWNELKWRDYFRGTSAHNTVRVDSLDQSVSGGRFMWTRKAKAKIEKMPDSPNEFGFAGSHDGYTRLSDPVRPLRRVQYDEANKLLMVRDEVVGKQAHLVEQFWHFAPNISVALEGTRAVITGERFRLIAEFTGGDLALELTRGKDNPPSGWISRSYESKEPCTTLRVFATASKVSIGALFKIEIPAGCAGG